MTTVACIFARGGSKGLPGKNVRPLGGKPLIVWSIEQALSVNRIDRVLVSTDSQEIADIAKQSGAEVPFIRPAELASDQSPEWLAWRHMLNFLKESEGCYPNSMISLPATAPLRSIVDIENCLDQYDKGEFDVVITMTDAHRNPYFNMVTQDKSGKIDLVIPSQGSVARRQDAPEVFDMTTVAYVVNPDFVMNKIGIFSGRVGSVYVPLTRAIDIDTLLDFKIAELLLEMNKTQNECKS